jgi:hypothetical protein
MSEQTPEPGVVEGGHLQKSMVIEAGLFVGGWQFRPHPSYACGRDHYTALDEPLPLPNQHEPRRSEKVQGQHHQRVQTQP